MAGHRHSWRYAGGTAKCTVPGCGKYFQPDGSITDTPTGRKRKTK